MTQYVGQQFGDYILTEYLGGGGFADVYLGQHIYLHTEEHPVRAAVKVLKGEFTAKEIAELHKEAQIIARLRYPHIVPIITFSVAKIKARDIPFLVMAHAPHGSLDKHHPRGTKLPLATIVSYVRQLAQALQFAHDHKVVHRDIKPANFLLGRDEEVLLSDFGIAVIAHRTRSWEEQKLIGTWSYAAPEHFDAKAVPASDQYSLGVVVYEWLCGSLPFKGNFVQLGYQHHFVPPPSLREKIPLSPTIEEVVFKALAKKPEDRYLTITDFADALEHAWRSIPLPGTTLDIYHCDGHQLLDMAWLSHTSHFACLIASEEGLAQVRNVADGNVISTSPITLGYMATAMKPIKLEDLPPGIDLWSVESEEILYHDYFEVWSWSPDGTQIALPATNTLDVWNITTGKITAICHGLPDKERLQLKCQWSPDGNWIALANPYNITVQVYDAMNGDVISSYRPHSDGLLSLIHWSPNGKYIASEYFGSVHVWDPATGNLITTYRKHDYGHRALLRCLAWSPDSTRIASVSGDGTTGSIIHLWDAITGKLIFMYKGHSKMVETIEWSPDGTRVASGSGDKTVQVWDATTGTNCATYYGHTGGLYKLAWSSNANYIASIASDDTGNSQTVEIWDANTPDNIFTSRFDFSSILGLIWSPDGTSVAFHNYKTAQVWQVANYV